MKVIELIAQLRTQPPEAEVTIQGNEVPTVYYPVTLLRRPGTMRIALIAGEFQVTPKE